MSDTADESSARPDAGLVTRLLQGQAPHLAHLRVHAAPASGSSNWVYRLGDDLAVRLPREESYVSDLLTEQRWLPRLASQVSTPIPDVVVAGAPAKEFGRPWSVVSWVPGEPPGQLDPEQQRRLAVSLGAFLMELHQVDTAGAPTDPSAWGYRCGEPVTEEIDSRADEVAGDLADLFDPRAVREAWRRLREVPPASQPVCWVHADLSSENLLVRPDGRLSGVVDFGAMGIGDRSVDLLYAWSLFGATERELVREASGTDEATWLRARAWAFVGPGLVTIRSYRDTLPGRTARLVAMVESVADEVGVRLR